MKKLLALLALAALPGCGGAGDTESAAPSAEARPGVILMKLRDQADAAATQTAQSLLEGTGATATAELPNAVRMVELSHSAWGAEKSVCQQLIDSGAVEFAEPDYKLPVVQDETQEDVALIPNDTYYSQQWFLPKVSAPAAWNVTRGSSSVVVAVCDTGVQANHPDLQANLLLPGYNSVDGTTNSNPVHPHGTMVSGCISAAGNNAQGVTGLAYGVRILPVRVSNDASGSAYLSDMANGVRWAADHGARIINLSYSGAQYATIDQAAQYARSKGALLFMAAGNEGLDVSSTYPDYSSFLLVGATNSADGRPSWSNYGTAVDMVAPGESIVTTTIGSTYASVSGTSFASPIAAAGGALLLSYNGSLTVSQLESALLASCDDVGAAGEDNVFGKGRLNAAAALARVTNVTQPNSAPIAAVSVSPSGGIAPLNVTWNGSTSRDPEGGALRYAWRFSDGTTATTVTVAKSYASAGTITANLTVTDPQGATSTASGSLTVAADPNVLQAPSNLSAGGTGTLVNLSWRDNSGNETGFSIERANQNTNPGVFTPFAAVGANTTAFNHYVTKGVTYLYRVQAVNATRKSTYSNILTVTR